MRLWNLNSGDEILNLSGHSSQVTTIAFSPNGSLLATGMSI